MSVDTEAPPAPPPGKAPPARRKLVWRALVAALVLLIAYVLYGGRLGAASTPREVRGKLQRLTYPSAFGRARVDGVVPGYERVQVGGFGQPTGRGPTAAVDRVWRMTRAGGLLFEVRGLASEGERDALLRRSPYACQNQTETQRIDTVAGVEIRRVQRGLLFRWLPSSVQLCGTWVSDSVLLHASGFATDATWHREAAQIRAMLDGWQVAVDRVPHDADGCRMHTEHEPPLYVKFRNEALAQVGDVTAESVEWIDLPYRREGSVGRFTPELLDQVVGACAEEQARFALLVESERDPESPEAQDAQHAFRARCEPLFPMLRFFGAEKLEPDVLPRPSEGWTEKLDARYVPALCLPGVSVGAAP